MDRVRTSRAPRVGRQALWATALVWLGIGLLTASQARAGGAIYTFIGPDGVIHFTDAPRDKRFRRLPDRKVESRSPSRPPPDRWEYDGLIGLTAREHEVEPALVKAVIAAESNFDPVAVSRKGAQGLMQVMPITGGDLGVEDPFQPTDNVRAGTRYLRSMLDRYGDLERAVAAYN